MVKVNEPIPLMDSKLLRHLRFYRTFFPDNPMKLYSAWNLPA